MATLNPFNVKNIIRGIAQVCMDAGGTMAGDPAPFTGYKIYASPTAEQLAAAGTPYLAVSRPRLAGYAIGGEMVGPAEAHGSGVVEPVWDFDVWTFHPYDPAYPNYDDATDDMTIVWQALMLNYTLPTWSIVQPGSTATDVIVAPGEGKRFRQNFYATIDGMSGGPIVNINGDTLTLYNPLPLPPTPGARASQGTCGNSYPYNASPDYAQLATGEPWCVMYLTVRAFEQLLSNFP